ncbi:MAG: hypothetical protein ACI3W8_05410 [Oscillospiraceae bacterium]
METYQLKKIIIIILALVNLALLGLLGWQELQRRGEEKQLLQQLAGLYEASGIELSLDSLPESGSRTTAAVVRSAAQEQALAQGLLGSGVRTQESGSATLYTSPAGNLRFRRNGAFELTLEQPFQTEEACVALLEKFGYTLQDRDAFSDGSGTLYLTQTLSGAAVAGGTAALTFQSGLLESASGYYVYSAQKGQTARDFSAADALTAFLSYCREGGVICGSVQQIEAAWQLDTETLFQSTLTPAWLIATDASYYYVNCATGAVAPLRPDRS